MMAFGFIMITLIFLIGWGFSVLATKDPRRRGAVWQCFFRSNFAIIGLPLAQSLGGAEGAAAAALLSAFSIPLFNVYGVIALSVYTGQKRSFGSVMKSIVVNPLTLGIFSGLIALAIRFGQLQLFGRAVFSLQRATLFLYKVLNHLKAATTPMAWIVLGGQCEFSAVKGMLKEILVAVGGRVVLAPVLALCTAITLSNMGWLPCGNGEYAALIALFGSPVAVVSAIIAGNMGSDKQLASQLVFWTSLVSVGTIFITVCVLMATGYLVAL
jgi:predicted permease